MWTITFYDGVQEELLDMPPGIQARMLRLLEMIEKYGPNLGPPHIKPLGEGLFEIRAKASEGIGRGLFCYRIGKNVHILLAFVKKDKAIPRKDLRLARKRLREVMKK